MVKRKIKRNVSLSKNEIANLLISFLLSLSILFLFKFQFFSNFFKAIYVSLLKKIFNTKALDSMIIFVEKNEIKIFNITPSCLGIFPISLSIFLVGICKNKIKRKISAFFILLIITFFSNLIRIIFEIKFSVDFLFPFTNFFMVVLVWFFMLKTKYLSIGYGRKKFRKKNR